MIVSESTSETKGSPRFSGKRLPIAHVTKLTGLHWHTIKEIDKARLQRQFGAFEGREYAGWSWTLNRHDFRVQRPWFILLK